LRGKHSSIPYQIDLTRTGECITLPVFRALDTLDELVRIQIGYGSPSIASVVKQIFIGGQWTMIDSLGFARDPATGASGPRRASRRRRQ